MDFEQRLRDALELDDTSDQFIGLVMARVDNSRVIDIRTRRRRRVIVFGMFAVVGVAAAMFIWPIWGPAPAPEMQAVEALLPVDDVGPTEQFTPAATSAPELPASEHLTGSSEGFDDDATMCARTIQDAEAFAKRERNAAYPTQVWGDEVPEVQTPEQSDDQTLAKLGGLQRNLARSRNPEAFLTAVLLQPSELRLSQDPAALPMLLDFGVRAADSGSSLLAWHALRACVQAGQSCPYEHLLPGLFETDRQNAEAWALMAILKYRRGDIAGALATMQGAARAPMSTWYWAESSALIERTLAAETAMPYPDRMANAFASAAAALPPTEVSTMCKVESARSRAWAQACLAFGTQRAERSDTTAAQGLSYGIRQQALMALGDTEGALEVVAGRALFDAEKIGGGLAPVGGLLMDLVSADPTRMRAYLGAVQQSGESAGARAFLRQELPSLLQRAGLLEREGARECVAQLFEPRVPHGTRAATAGHQIQVADDLLISVRGPSLATTVQVRPDGTIKMPLVSTSGLTMKQFEQQRAAAGLPAQPLEREFAAVGKTTGQLQREIATALTTGNRSPEVLVILISPRSREELLLAFENAWKETVERREKPH